MILRPAKTDGIIVGYAFWCGGCNTTHYVPIRGDHGWGFNDDEANPSFVPSVLLTESKAADGHTIMPRCHLYVTDGKLHYLSDCGHELAGQVVPMTDLDESI